VAVADPSFQEVAVDCYYTYSSFVLVVAAVVVAGDAATSYHVVDVET
jgi:hypothetical protein